MCKSVVQIVVLNQFDLSTHISTNEWFRHISDVKKIFFSVIRISIFLSILVAIKLHCAIEFIRDMQSHYKKCSKETFKYIC